METTASSAFRTPDKPPPMLLRAAAREKEKDPGGKSLQGPTGFSMESFGTLNPVY